MNLEEAMEIIESLNNFSAHDWEAWNAIRAELDRLREERRWIPVAEGLPRCRVVCLVCMRQVLVTTAALQSDGTWVDETMDEIIGITHWQPLPQPTEVCRE